MKNKSKDFLKRSRAAKKGWITRRRNQRKGAGSTPHKGRGGRERGRRQPPAPRQMFRVTVAANYYIRAKKQRNRKGTSPESAAYIVRAWYKTEKEARAAIDDLSAQVEEGRDNVIEDTPRAFTKDEDIDIEIKALKYNADLIDTMEEVNEK